MSSTASAPSLFPARLRFYRVPESLFIVLGGLIGVLAWGGASAVLPLLWILVLPLAWGIAGTRISASLLVMAYYLAAARGLPGGAIVFFGDSAPVWLGWAMWAVSSLLLTAPFACLWTAQRSALPGRFLAALCISSIPPLALIGWVSPLALAGVLFPGLGWLGLASTLLVLWALVSRHCWVIVGFSAAALAANCVASPSPTSAPVGWQGINTHFPGLSSAGAEDAGQLLATLHRVDWVNDLAKTVPPHSVWVLPETVLGTFDGVADFALQDTEAALTARGSRLLVGAELPQRSGKYKNAVLVLGAKRGEDRAAVQGIPAPFSMWKPWALDGAVADVFGRSNLVAINGLQVGTLVCYEQVLAFSYLWVMRGNPDVVVAVSNVWWARATSIPNIQRQTVEAFGRLFGVAVVAAKNS